jgi:hypothetical protein
MADYVFTWDASDYDWSRGLTEAEVRQSALDGIGGYTHKITEGTKFIHKNAGRFLRAAGSAKWYGLYIVPRTPGNGGHGNIAQQVDYALAESDRQYPEWRTNGRFFWQVDLEHWGYDNVNPVYGIEMANRLAGTGKRVTLYAPKWAYGDSIPANPYPMWSSDYGANNAATWQSLWSQRQGSQTGFNAYSGKVPLIWQFGSKAVIGGQATCDINVFRGTMADFGAQIVGFTSAPPAPAPSTLDILNVRYLG